MKDVTLLHYTCNRVDPDFAARIRFHQVSFGLPIVCVSFSPMNVLPFADEYIQYEPRDPAGPSEYHVYAQVLAAARLAKTPYVCCVEDDGLYNAAHFSFRPPTDSIAFNMNRWSIVQNGGDPIYYWRGRAVNSQCVAPRQLLIDTLQRRYDKFPTYQENLMKYWSEPTRAESKLGLPIVPRVEFKTKQATIIFKHRQSLSSVRARKPTDIIQKDLEGWPSAPELWREYCGKDFR